MNHRKTNVVAKPAVCFLALVAACAATLPSARAQQSEIAEGISLVEQGNADRGLSVLNQVLLNSSLDSAEMVTVLWNMGRAAHAADNPEAAAGYYNHALWLNALPQKQTAEVYSDRAAALFAGGDYISASWSYDAALDNDPGNVTYMFNSGVSALRGGNAELARQKFAAVIDTNHELTVPAEYGTSLAALISEKYDIAINSADNAVAFAPDFELADSLLEDIERGDVNVAQRVSTMPLAADLASADDGSSIVADTRPALPSDNAALATLITLDTLVEEETPAVVEAPKQEEDTSKVAKAAKVKEKQTPLARRADNATVAAALRGLSGIQDDTTPTPRPHDSSGVSAHASAASRDRSRTSEPQIAHLDLGGGVVTVDGRYYNPLILGEMAAADALRRAGLITATQAAKVMDFTLPQPAKAQAELTNVVLGHFPDNAVARAGWRIIVRKHTDLLQGLAPVYAQVSEYVSPTRPNSSETLLMVGPFVASASKALCANLRNDGLRCTLYDNLTN